jgi:hypothetical protein
VPPAELAGGVTGATVEGAAGAAGSLAAGSLAAGVSGVLVVGVDAVVGEVAEVDVAAVSSFFSTIVKRITAKMTAQTASTPICTIGFSFSAFLMRRSRSR